MLYISCFSGIEAASVAVKKAGLSWEPVAFSEIEPFASAVLAHHYPQVPNLGDITKINWEKYAGTIGLVCGGSPCQAFSVAGLRRSLSDPRGNLTLEYMRAVHQIKPRWVVWEQVPGVMSASGNPLGCFMAGLAGYDFQITPPGGRWGNVGFLPAKNEQSYSIAYRILDAQHFGVPQRRRRIFLVGHIGTRDWWKPLEVLLERDREGRDFAPGRKAGQKVAGNAGGGIEGVVTSKKNPITLLEDQGGSVMSITDNHKVVGTLRRETHGNEPVLVMAHGQGGAEIREDQSPTLTCNHEASIFFAPSIFDATSETLNTAQGGQRTPCVAFAQNTRDEVRLQGGDGQVVGALSAQPGMKQTTYLAFVQNQEGELRTSNQELFSQRGAGLVMDRMLYEHHMQDSRAKGLLKVCPQLNAKAGTGGGNLPLVQHAIAFNWQSGGDCRLQPSNDMANTVQRCQTQAVAFAQNQEGELRTSETMGTLGTTQNASGRATGKIIIDKAPNTLYIKGITQGVPDAGTQERNPHTPLRTLREEIGEEAFTKWGLGILDSFQKTEVLRKALYGKGIRYKEFPRCWMVYNALSRTKSDPAWLLQSLRETECKGCPPQGWRPSEQLAGELGAYLSELSLAGPSEGRFMQDMWNATEGAGPVRYALSTIQEIWGSFNCKDEPAHATTKDGGAPQERKAIVRRITPVEAEFLQKFPRNYTRIPYRGKPAELCPDGPRYKALGNSWAVPVAQWVFERIDKVDKLYNAQTV